MIRWEQIQHISTSEAEINLLAGLTANASKINVLTSYTGTGADLNAIIGVGDSFDAHTELDAASAHEILAGSIDGLAIADGTLPASKLSFSVVTPTQLNTLGTTVTNLRSDHEVLVNEVSTLTGLVIPGQGADILDSINETMAHINDTSNAHDASAISYGELQSGFYLLNSSATAGQPQLDVGTARTRFFRAGDTLIASDFINTEAPKTVLSVNHDTGIVTLTTNLANNLTTSQTAKVINLSENTVQNAVARSLRNTTDALNGRLTINNALATDALVINKSGSGKALSFAGAATLKSAAGYDFLLGAGSQSLTVTNSSAQTVFAVDATSKASVSTVALTDGANAGTITKTSLTANRTWTLPNKSGGVALDSDIPEVFEVANLAALNALTGMIEGDIALVADNGFGDGVSYIYTGSAWTLLGTTAVDKQVFVEFIDPVSMVLPAGASAIVDGIPLANGDKVLFTKLTVGNNKIYQVSGVGTSMVWAEQSDFQNGTLPVLGEAVRIKKGNAFQFNEAIFDGTTFKVNDVIRLFSGADFWELSSLKTASILPSTTDDIFSVGLVGSENITIEYSIGRGTAKETGNFFITSDGTTVTYTRMLTNIGTVDVELFADIDAGNVRFRYTAGAGASGVMKYFVKRWSNTAGGPTGIPSYSATGSSSIAAAGNISEIQYHGIGGVLFADADFKWNDTTKELNIGTLKIGKLQQVALSDNQAVPATAASFNQSASKFIFLDYSIERGTESRSGIISICSNATTASLTDTFAETAGPGVGGASIIFTAELSGGNIVLKYFTDSTGNAATLRYAVRKW